nr:MAG TPA: hypothetical protein [Caudoviricetes sp.]
MIFSWFFQKKCLSLHCSIKTITNLESGVSPR